VLYSVHDINNCIHEDAMRVFPHLDAVKCIANPIQGEVVENVILGVTTQISDHISGKKCALKVRIVQVIKLAIT
jgi:hypothetical protein